MLSIYQLKPAFQQALRPWVRRLYVKGVTANQVTLFACALSVGLGLAITASGHVALFLLMPLWMFVRMALNAVDGLLAREFNQKSPLGAYLNELTDSISDLFLFLPFAFLPHFSPYWVVLVMLLSVLVEYAGVLGLMVGASRRYDGPFGKSDRAFVLGALALALGLGLPVQPWQGVIFPAMAVLLVLTLVQRIRKGLAEGQPSP